MKITFLGAAEEVTGSKYLVEQGDVKILVDCGLFQGTRELTQLNYEPIGIVPEQIDAVVLTHAHIDHTGYIPALVKQGFKGAIYCSAATYKMCRILLLDSATLQEEDAKHHPGHQALYTRRDAEQSFNFFKQIEYDTAVTIRSLKITLIRSGHILGSAFVIVSNGQETLTFSGDLGRPVQPILKAPTHLTQTDYLVLESTYGDRVHEEDDPEKVLSQVIHDTVQRGGVLVVPSFSVMRTQTLLYYLYQLKQKKLIPPVPIFLDSPSAIAVTDLFCQFSHEHILSPDVCKAAFSVAKYVETVEASKKLDLLRTPAIIIAGSGMADGGRVIFHMKKFITNTKNTVLFVGYQARGSKGRLLLDGIKDLRIFGQEYPVRADIQHINSLSAHADSEEILQWLSYFKTAPKKVFLTHGELESAQALKQKIEQRFGWVVEIPKLHESDDLS